MIPLLLVTFSLPFPSFSHREAAEGWMASLAPDVGKMSDSEKMAKAASILREDSEVGGLVQLLAMALHSKGLSAADIDGVCKRERRWELKKGEMSWAGWVEDWMTESACWLRQPGVWDGVSKKWELERIGHA